MSKLSIITINYNNVAGLERTFRSVFSQICQDFEYIVIDGGSTDGSAELIEQNQDHIAYWASERDNGIYHAMNKGILVAKGEYLLFLNSGDDFFDTNVLKNCITHFDGTEIICGNAHEVDKNHSWVKTHPSKLSILFFCTQYICHQSTFIRRSCFETYGLYDENHKIISDWKWFLIAIFKRNATYKSLDLIVSNFYKDGISADSNNSSLQKIEREEVLHEIIGPIYPDFKELLDFKVHLDRVLSTSRWIKLGKALGLLKDLNEK